MIKITPLTLIYVILMVVVVGIFAILIIRHRQHKKFDTTPRDKNGEEIEAYDEDGDPASAPVYEDDLTFDDWQNWEDFLQEVGVINISNGMIEYDTGDNSRLFVMLAEMAQSNPYLKTDDEMLSANAITEVFLNGLMNPLKETSQSQKVEMTDFLNDLKENSQYITGATPAMKEYARNVIDETLEYQRATDRFENKAYLQFQAVVEPDEVFGDTPSKIEKAVQQKAMEKLVRQIERADSLLRRADHDLAPLDTFGLLEVFYKTFNRQSSVKIRFEDIVRKQRFTLFTSSHQNDIMFKKVQQMIHIETLALEEARSKLIEKQKQENAEKLRNGEDIYSSGDVNPLDIEHLV